MARIQILELPTTYHENGDDETPFVLIIDQASKTTVTGLGAAIGEKIGARAILVSEETIEIPANQISFDDGQTMQLKIAPDLSALRRQVKAAVADAQNELKAALPQGPR